MTKLLKRLAFVYKMPKSVPAKANADVQRPFVEQTLAPLMEQADADNPLYFADATHPSRTAHPWISGQILREYLAAVTRPPPDHGALPMPTAIERVRFFAQRFDMAEDGPNVRERLL